MVYKSHDGKKMKVVKWNLTIFSQLVGLLSISHSTLKYVRRNYRWVGIVKDQFITEDFYEEIMGKFDQVKKNNIYPESFLDNLLEK